MVSRNRRRIHRSLALICLVLALGMPLGPTSAAVRHVQLDAKSIDSARLVELSNAIDNAKSQLAANPTDVRLHAGLNAATAEYDALSARLGGDRATTLGEPLVARRGSVGVIPPAPPGCTATTATYANPTPVTIPTGPAVVTSTIVVTGAGASLYDVNAQTFLQHTFSADLDVTITSPAGTVVTLTTDNGAGNDDVFNGTVWDDDANPSGQVPYVSNNGIVTDTVYANLVVATPLTPEEPFGAFIGEDPNGTWTLTISDDLAGDGGSLNSWSLEITTLPAAPTLTSASASNATPVTIPTGPAVVTSTIVVSGAGASLYDVNLTTFIQHTFSADLDVTITSPAGTVVTLTTDNGAGNDDVFNGTVWDDDANPSGQVPYVSNNGMVTDNLYANLVLASPLTPEEPLSAFVGEDPNGTWTLTISDDLAGDGGSLNSWSLDVTTAACASPCSVTCPANVTTSNDPNQCGAVVNYPAPTATGDCGTVTCSPASGSFFPNGTTTVTCTPTTGAGCSFTVTVNDTQAPTITCPANITRTNVPNQCGAIVSYAATASDNCAGVTVVCAPASGSFFALGTTTVSCTATDSASNTSACSFTVTVNDTQAPAITCPANVTAVANTTQGNTTGANVTYPAPTVTDNCPAPNAPTCSPASGSFFPTGTTTVTCSVIDASGNPASCSFTVAVGSAFNNCYVDDATGDTFSIVTNPASPLYRLWQYRVAATGQILQGSAESLSYAPNRSLVAYDRDNPTYRMDANFNLNSRSGTVTVVDLTTGIRHVLRDRNTANDPPCQ